MPIISQTNLDSLMKAVNEGKIKYYVNNVDASISNPMLNFSTLKAPKRLPKDLFMEQVKVLLTPNEKNESLKIIKEGQDLTILTIGNQIDKAIKKAKNEYGKPY